MHTSQDEVLTSAVAHYPGGAECHCGEQPAALLLLTDLEACIIIIKRRSGKESMPTSRGST